MPIQLSRPSVGHFSSVHFTGNLIYCQVRLGPGPFRCPSLTRLPMWEPIPGPLLTNHLCSAVGAQIIFLRMISSCPNSADLHADVSDGEDLYHHQQEVTGGQLVTMSLVPGTVDSKSNVASECHLCCPPGPPLPTVEVSSLDGS